MIGSFGGLAHQRDKIGQIVLELAEIGDVAARAGAAMAADVGRIGLDAARGERVRQRMHGRARSRRAMHQDRDLAAPLAPRRIVPVGQIACRRGRGSARSAGMVLRSTAPAVCEIERSSGGRFSGVATIAVSSSATAPDGGERPAQELRGETKPARPS